jgi:C-terminal processing protease CtpA/Prc
MLKRCLFAICFWCALGAAGSPTDYQNGARDMDEIIERSYAYLDKLPGGTLPRSLILNSERDAVSNERSLLRYAEDRMASLADHHAITGSSFADSWAVIPTYADLWIVARDGQFIVDAVRDNSPAMRAGVRAGDKLIAVNGIDTGSAVQAYWTTLGLAVTPPRAEYAARVLAAGRRDRDRVLTIKKADGSERKLILPSLYRAAIDEPPLTVSSKGGSAIIRFNNSLGDDATIAAFDAAMLRVPVDRQLILDLRETPSGGNTTVARAVMGWFVARPTNYQVHNRPADERETGIARQWVEQVLPRQGKYRRRLPSVLVGRWTGSMGEGLAIGFVAIGADVRGTRMAGLNGSVEAIPLGDTGLSIKLPTERLMTSTYQPREDFVPKRR